MKRYLSRLSLEITDRKPATAQELTEIMKVVTEIHDEMMNDIVLQPAAFGCAIGCLSMSLDVTLRTAAMLFEEWQRLHPPKDNGDSIKVVVINSGAEDEESG